MKKILIVSAVLFLILFPPFLTGKFADVVPNINPGFAFFGAVVISEHIVLALLFTAELMRKRIKEENKRHDVAAAKRVLGIKNA
jgi:hypothetical protein